MRTHNCSQLRESNVGEKVVLNGWLHSVRDLGAVVFFVLRDFYGMTQVTVSDEEMKEKAYDNWGSVGMVVDDINAFKLTIGDRDAVSAGSIVFAIVGGMITITLVALAVMSLTSKSKKK